MKLPTIIGLILGTCSIAVGLYDLLLHRRPPQESLVPVIIGSLVIGVAVSTSRKSNANSSDRMQ